MTNPDQIKQTVARAYASLNDPKLVADGLSLDDRSQAQPMSIEELRDGLIKLAKLTGFSVTEIDQMAGMIAQAEYDPLPPDEWGNSFEFGRHRLSLLDDDDFACISAEVPKPDAQVDLRLAWQEYLSDLCSIGAIYASGRELSLAKSWLLFQNGLDWFRFWSARHPDPSARAKFAQALAEAEAANEQLAEKVNARLSKTNR